MVNAGLVPATVVDSFVADLYTRSAMAQMWIDNRWSNAADGRVFEVRNPATEEVLDAVPRASAADVERAVRAARKAFPDWRRTPGIERGEKLRRQGARQPRLGLDLFRHPLEVTSRWLVVKEPGSGSGPESGCRDLPGRRGPYETLKEDR